MQKRHRIKVETEPGTKYCPGCREVKPNEAFGPEPRKRNGLKSWCRACESEAHRRGYQENPQKERERVLKANYGITYAEYDALLAKQGGVCAICQQPETYVHWKGKPKILAVDHDHKTGRIRGLLCTRCNHAIGYFEDNPERMARAIAYLAQSVPLEKVAQLSLFEN